MGAEEISPLPGAGEKSGPLPMNAPFPGFINVPMAFAAEPIAFRKVDQIPIVEPQFVSIPRIMAIETPSHRFGVMEFDIRVFFFQFSLLSIQLHRGMAVVAGKHPFCHRRRGYRKLFLNSRSEDRKTGLQQKNDDCDRIAYWVHLLGMNSRKSKIGAIRSRDKSCSCQTGEHDKPSHFFPTL